MAKRTRGGHPPQQQPESTACHETPAAPAAPRDSSGRWLPGGPSPNPGGIPRQVYELRRLALDNARTALERAIEMIQDADPKTAAVGISTVLERGLGRPSAPSELPDDTTARAVDTTPAGLLTVAMTTLGRVLAHQQARLDAGHPLGAGEIETLSEAARTLSVLAKEERQLQKDGAAAALSDEALVAAVLSALPLERLRAALAERETAPGEAA